MLQTSAVQQAEPGHLSVGSVRRLSSSSSDPAIQAAQPLQLSNGAAGGNRLDVSDITDKLEVHAAILTSSELVYETVGRGPASDWQFAQQKQREGFGRSCVGGGPLKLSGGVDGTRTRGLRRDRPAF